MTKQWLWQGGVMLVDMNALPSMKIPL